MLWKKTMKESINEFIREHDNKPIIFVGSLDNFGPKNTIYKTPKNEQKVFGKYRFVTGNELWTVVIWFYLQNLFTKHNLSLNTKNNLFVVKSFVTSDSIKAVCKKFHIKCIDGNVGFSELTNLVQKNLKKNLVNIGKFEESNGFTIAGNPIQHLSQVVVPLEPIQRSATCINFAIFSTCSK